jgi:hypothetical protein
VYPGTNFDGYYILPTGVSATAVGGAGGQGEGAGQHVGTGGAATALATGDSTTGGSLIVTATAIGGAAGAEISGASGRDGGGASAIAEGVSTSGTVDSTATAIGGAGSSNAEVGGGALGYASAEGINGYASSTASTSGSLVNSIVATGTALAGGNSASATETDAAVDVAAGSYTSLGGLQAAAFGIGLPTNVSTLVASATNVKQVFEAAGATTYGAVYLEAASRTDTGSPETFTLNVSFNLNTTQATAPHLDVGLIAATSKAGSGGFDQLVLTILVGGATEETQTFTSLAAAVAFFGDDVLDLGTLPDSSSLSVDFNLAYTSTGGGDGFDSELVFGAAAAQAPKAAVVPAVGGAAPFSPAIMAPEPSTWMLLLVVSWGAVLLVTGRRRRRA